MRIVIALALAIFVSSATSLDLPDIVASIRPGVVGIGTAKPPKRLNASEPAINFFGTGFVVGDGRQVITNNHVIDRKLDQDQKEALVVFVGRGEDSEVRPAKIVKIDEQHDLALLEIPGTPVPALALGERATIREGREIAFTGFPIGIVLGLYPVTHKGIISAITPIVIPANSSKLLSSEQIKRIRDPFEVYQLDAIAYPGSSGSPVYETATGEVIGVVNSVFVKETREAALQRPSGIAYAIPVRYVAELID